LANGKVLILEDRYALKDSMVNLGDRAYHVGLHNLLEGHLGLEISMGPVKALPYLTADKTRKISSPEDARLLFERWWQKLCQGNRSSLKQTNLKQSFEDNFVTRSGWFRSMDDRVRHRLARGILETASPYLFRGHFVEHLVNKIEEADLVIFNGGAFVADHLDRYLPMVLFELYVAKKLGKPTAVVNQTVSISRPSNKAMVSYLYSLLDGHWVREPRSRQKLIDLGIPDDRIHLSCDAAFGLEVPGSRRQRPGHSSGTVGICVRGDRPVRSEHWARVSDYLKEKHHFVVRFFFTSEFQDKNAYDRISKHSENDGFLEFCNYDKLIEQIQDFDFVITDRYHATIFSVLAATPFITMDSNTFKTRGLMDLFDYPIDVISEDADLDSMKEKIEEVIAKRATLQTTLGSAAGKLSAYAKSSLDSLGDIAVR
jgi:polysaccharide pyruvyl transferase WcaK-like protein